MKQLRSLALMVAAFVLSSSFTPDDNGKNFKGETSRIEVSFSRKLDFSDLVKIKLDMAAKGVVLEYRKLQFDKNGKLEAIDFSVDFKDGFSGAASNDKLVNQSHFGFFRDYNKKASVPFGTGNY